MYNFLKKILNTLNKILIPILVTHELYNLLSLLLILNLNKIKKILPKNKPKYKAIVLSKSGGTEDLVESQTKYNKNILYLSCPRPFFKHIFLTIFDKSIKDIRDHRYSSKKKKIKNLKIKYKNFLVSFLKILKKRYSFNIFIGFNFNYLSERELHSACQQLKIPFLLLFKESIHTKLQEKYLIYTYKKINEKFNGYKVAAYSKYAKNLLTKSNIIKKDKVEVVGCSRLSLSYRFKKIIPKNQIIYYAMQVNRGLPNALIGIYGRSFYNDLNFYNKYDTNFNWEKVHLKTLKILKIFAHKNPKVSIIVKIKIGEIINANEYKNLPKNMKIVSTGTGHEYLKDSKVVIAWNTTSVLEGIAANRFILMPYFATKNKFSKMVELQLNLKKQSYGKNENDFYKKLNSLMKKKYNNNKINNNLSSLNYYLGNADNKSGLRLDKFIKKNLIYKD